MENNLNDQIMFFKQENLSHITNIPLSEPSVSNILNTVVWVKINEIRLIQTDKGVSNAGIKITGSKLMVRFKIEGKITYVSEESIKSVHATKFETEKSSSIIVPREKDGKSILNLYRENRISVTPYIEGTYSRRIDEYTIYSSVLVLLDASICS